VKTTRHLDSTALFARLQPDPKRQDEIRMHQFPRRNERENKGLKTAKKWKKTIIDGKYRK